MGIVHSDVTNNVKAQADAGQETVAYKLIDVKGGGELIQLMKDSNLIQNKKKLDEEIRQKIFKYLYNDGKGDKIPIERIVYHRSSNKEKIKNMKLTTEINMENLATKENTKIFKRVCWDIDKRGAVGETPLLLCLLVGSTLHKELAKRLIQLFPELVNDIYLSDEFYGENALHLAIVNEDANMVKYLLSYDVDIHQRCCGRFFCPDDQKKRRIESLYQEYPILPKDTNYSGFSYFGEYPLSFAAVMGQVDCMRLLFAKGVDPNKQDSNGNTVLHMLVIHNKLLIENGARLDIKNNCYLTPLNLAAKMGREEIFQYILKKIRKIFWIYGDITCGAYSLTDLDTISENGSTNTKSVLYLLVNSHTEDHLQLFDGLVLDLLQQKWDKFVKIRFYIELLYFILFYVALSVSVFLKRLYLTYLIELSEDTNSSFYCLNITKNIANFVDDPYCNCLYRNPIDPNGNIRYTIEALTVLFALIAIIRSVFEMKIEKFNLCFKILIDSPTKLLFLNACFLIIIIIPFRFTCDYSSEDILSILVLICMTMHFLYYFRGFRSIGPIVLIFEKMIKGDLVIFFTIYIIFVTGFSQSLYIATDFGIHDIHAPRFETPFDAMFNMFTMSIGEFAPIYSAFTGIKYESLAQILSILFVMISGVILINTLIAAMGNTFALVNETKNENLRQWAKVVLSIEQSVPHKYRLKYQKRYSHLLYGGTSEFIVKWKQSSAEREELVEDKMVFHSTISQIPPMPISYTSHMIINVEELK